MQSSGRDAIAAAAARPGAGAFGPLRAGIVSIALHIALVLAASSVPWPESGQHDRQTPSVVWITTPLAAEGAEDALQADAARASAAAARAPGAPDVAELAPVDVLETTRRAEPLDVPEPSAPEPLDVSERAEPEPSNMPEPAEPEPSAAGPEADRPEPDAEQAPERQDDETAPEDQRDRLPRDVDWDAERRRAVRSVIEQRERENGYATFSFEDLEQEQAPAAEPGPERSVFESSSSGGPGVLSSSKARSRAGRWVAEKCERILGGVSILGLVSLCAPNNARSDLFASIKPRYLEARPVCTEVDQPAAGNDETGRPKKTHNCRLVVDGE